MDDFTDHLLLLTSSSPSPSTGPEVANLVQEWERWERMTFILANIFTTSKSGFYQQNHQE